MVFNLFNSSDTNDGSTEEPQEESSTDNNAEAQQRENTDNTTTTDNSDGNDDFPYDYTPVKRETLGGKPWADISADGEYYAGAHVRANFENARNNPEQKLYFGANLDDQRGLKPGAIQFNNLFKHLWISGSSGYGKSTEQKNYMLQLAEMGYGFVYFDPKAEDSHDFLRKLPEHRREDVIWVEPGSKEHGKNVGINILGVKETDDETEKALEIADKLENLRAVFDQFEFWGPNMEGITMTIGRGMMNHNADPDTDTNYTVMDMFLVLANQRNRREFAENVDDPFVRLALDKIADMDDEEIWPIFNRMRDWATDTIVREIISQREDTLDFDKAIAEDKIIIVRTPVSSKAVMRMVALTVLRGVWTAVQRRAADEHDPRPYFAILDEFDIISSENLDVENILARARSMNLSAMLSTQYPSQLTGSVQTALQNNCDNKIVFYHGGSEDASIMMENFRDYGAEDNMESDYYEVWMQLKNEDNEKQEATKLQTYPEYPPVRSEEEAQQIIKDSLDKYGSEALTTRDILEQLPEDELGISVDDLLYMLNDADEPDDEDESTPFDTTPDPLDIEFPDTLPESEFTHTVATAQLQTGVGRNGYANLDTLDTLTEHISGIDREFLTTLAEEIIEKQHTDIRVIEEEDTYWFGLTNPAQEAIYEQDTGDAATDGETEEHTPLLYTAQSTLTTLGYHVDIIAQDGTELPDGVATVPVKNTLDTNVATPEQFEEQLETYHSKLADVHPGLLEMSHGRDLSIEAETSPGKKPVRPLVNLRKALDEDRKCLFIVKDDGQKLDRFAARISRILNAPAYVSDETAEGLTKYYNHSHSEHEATITKDNTEYNLAAPKTRGGSNWWDTESGEYALKSNKTSDAHITTAEPWNLTYSDIKGTNVAYYQRDHSEQKYYVWVPDGNGFTKREYDTKAQFQEDWAKIHEPFIPTREFGEELPDEDDYTILIDTHEDRTNVPSLESVPSVVQYNVKDIKDDAHQTVDAEYTPVLRDNEEPPHTPNLQDVETEPEEESNTDTTDDTESNTSGGSGGSILEASFPDDDNEDTREDPDEPGSNSTDSDGEESIGNGFNKDLEFGGTNTDTNTDPFDTTEETDSTDDSSDNSDDEDSDNDDGRIFG